MSFFDDNKKIGLALIIIGIVMLIAGLVRIIGGAIDDSKNLGAQIAYGVAGIIGGILWLLYGLNVRKGSNDKVAIVSGIVRTIGVITILVAIFNVAGNYMASSTYGVADIIVGLIVALIIGLIYLWISFKIAGGNKNIISKILWVLLLIASLIMVLVNIVGILGSDIFGIIACICWVIVYIYVFLACLSKEVKSAMGM